MPTIIALRYLVIVNNFYKHSQRHLYLSYLIKELFAVLGSNECTYVPNLHLVVDLLQTTIGRATMIQKLPLDSNYDSYMLQIAIRQYQDRRGWLKVHQIDFTCCRKLATSPAHPPAYLEPESSISSGNNSTSNATPQTSTKSSSSLLRASSHLSSALDWLSDGNHLS